MGLLLPEFFMREGDRDLELSKSEGGSGVGQPQLATIALLSIRFSSS